mmetsp:Transcript_8994/g.14726  ORF Transcript_8994/g.14726 Transcript_8994/m.14726 type:complete len:98 (+) Transcript_8994:1735-2028(+)
MRPTDPLDEETSERFKHSNVVGRKRKASSTREKQSRCSLLRAVVREIIAKNVKEETAIDPVKLNDVASRSMLRHSTKNRRHTNAAIHRSWTLRHDKI